MGRLCATESRRIAAYPAFSAGPGEEQARGTIVSGLAIQVKLRRLSAYLPTAT